TSSAVSDGKPSRTRGCFTTEPTEELKLAHFPKLQGGSYVGLSHRLVIRPIARAGEQLHPVHLDGIMPGSICSKNGKAPVEALRTATAMGVKLGHLVSPRAADGILNQLAAAAINNGLDNVRPGFPNEGIVNFNRLPDSSAEKLPEELKNQGMSSPRCARADDLLGNRQIDAHDAILKEPNPTIFKKAGDNTGQRSIEKGSRALRMLLDSEWFLPSHKHRNMQQLVRKSPPQLCNELLLVIEYL